MFLRAVTVITFLASAVPAIAAEQGSIRYDFFTVLVPDEVSLGERVIGRNDPWFTGKAFPRRVVRTLESVTIAEQGITLPKGTLLGLADSDKLLGCSFDAAIKFRMGRSRACLIDMNNDGHFDHWFRRGGDIVFYPYSSKISLDDILPVGTVPMEEVKDWQSVPDGVHFQARFYWNQLRACTGVPELALTMQCTEAGAKITRDGTEHRVNFLGGAFKYRYVDKRFTVQTLTPPEISTSGGAASAK